MGAAPPPGPPLDGPPIRDPFARWEAPPGAPPPPSRLPTAALILGASAALLGPLVGLAAIVVGALAPRGPGRSRARLGAALGAAFSVAWAGALGAAWWWTGGLAGPPRRVAASERQPPAAEAVPRPRTFDPGPTGSVPRSTVVREEGAIVVVDVGVQEDSLAAALKAQVAAARADGEEVLVTTTRAGCEPCEGLVLSLPDALMQDALGRVRLVRVDIDVFGEDLAALRMPSEVIPGFFLLQEDLTPRDAVHGGEWGEDVAPNIAPVLGPFVRGALRERRYAWDARRFRWDAERGSRRGAERPSAAPPPASARGIWL